MRSSQKGGRDGKALRGKRGFLSFLDEKDWNSKAWVGGIKKTRDTACSNSQKQGKDRFGNKNLNLGPYPC